MNIRFHPGALLEYEDAVSYYERRQVDLGKRFILMVEVALDSIREAPMRWPILEQDVRRHLIKVFPYAVLYTSEGDHNLGSRHHAQPSRARVLAGSPCNLAL